MAAVNQQPGFRYDFSPVSGVGYSGFVHVLSEVNVWLSVSGGSATVDVLVSPDQNAAREVSIFQDEPAKLTAEDHTLFSERIALPAYYRVRVLSATPGAVVRGFAKV